jgi:hypothetical protein
MFNYEDTQKLRGSVDIKLFGPDGSVKESRYIPNLVVQSGKTFIAVRMLGPTTVVGLNTDPRSTSTLTSCMSHMGIGTSTATAAPTDTSLTAEVAVLGDITAYSRASITTSSNSTGIVTYVATFGTQNPNRSNSSNTTAITEAGIFNSSNTQGTGGTMLCRTTFNAVNKGNDDTLQITWTITIS